MLCVNLTWLGTNIFQLQLELYSSALGDFGQIPSFVYFCLLIDPTFMKVWFDWWLMTGERVNCLVPGVQCLVPGDRCLVSEGQYSLTSAQWLVTGAWCSILSDRWLVTGAQWLVTGETDCLVTGNWWQVPGRLTLWMIGSLVGLRCEWYALS